MKIIVSFSGGKDSQACLIQAVEKYGSDKVEAVFCDTGWEHPATYRHVEDITRMMKVGLTVLTGAYSFVSLAKHKNRFPSVKARFCTEELKIKPMIDWVLSQSESLIIIQGIRSGESAARSAMEPECMYFQNYFTAINGKKYSYRKKEVIEWCEKYDASILRPIKEWSSQDVIDCILNHNQLPNPLYYRGFKRVGCFPCIMCRLKEIELLSKDPDEVDKLIKAEEFVGSSFFSTDTIPERFYKDKNKPRVQDVIKYVTDKTATLDMFEPEGGYSCMSMFHGLCE